MEKEFDFKGRPNAPKRVNEIDSPTDHTIVVENKGQTNTSYLMIGFLGPKANQLKENIEYIKQNYVEEYLTTLIVS